MILLVTPVLTQEPQSIFTTMHVTRRVTSAELQEQFLTTTLPSTPATQASTGTSAASAEQRRVRQTTFTQRPATNPVILADT